MMTKLKELKNLYPDHVKTFGNVYMIEGFGWYRQKTDAFGTTTFERRNDEWLATSFKQLVASMAEIFDKEN